jgi:hypothetical protein
VPATERREVWVERTATASGGWEWYLVLGGDRVTGSSVATVAGDTSATFSNMLGPLLIQAIKPRP